jgi:hypothetical protein
MSTVDVSWTRMRWVIVALFGCNQVFGLHRTTELPPADAQKYDAMLDAPFACPPIGTPPAFVRRYHQPFVQSCTMYIASLTASFATALCHPDPETSIISEGPINEAMTTSTFVPPNITLANPKLGPDGDVLLAHLAAGSTNTIALYDRTGSTWTFRQDAYTLPLTDPDAIPSTPMRNGSFLTYTTNNGGEIHEIVHTSPGTWADKKKHTLTELGVSTVVDHIGLSPDGLRIVFRGATLSPVMYGIFYADRQRPLDPFNGAILLDLPNATDPFMTEDCGRLYFDAIGTVFYVQRR